MWRFAFCLHFTFYHIYFLFFLIAHRREFIRAVSLAHISPKNIFWCFVSHIHGRLFAYNTSKQSLALMRLQLSVSLVRLLLLHKRTRQHRARSNKNSPLQLQFFSSSLEKIFTCNSLLQNYIWAFF